VQQMPGRDAYLDGLLESAIQTHARSIQALPLCGALLLVEWSGANSLSLITTFVGASSRHQRTH
jgi:hypothetical protein